MMRVKPDEEQDIASKLSVLPERRDIKMENVCFSYDGADRDYVLDNVSLVIPEHKVTAYCRCEREWKDYSGETDAWFLFAQ